MAESKNTYRYWKTVQSLRGIAALSVCIFHFSAFWSEDLWVRNLSFYGKYGVQAFFVISGFILPYTLYHKKHKINAYPQFILKRLIRLEPPYIISIITLLALRWAAATFSPYSTQVFSIDWANLAWHIGYLVPFVEGEYWLNPVFWTLAIEFQFYLFIGLYLVLLVHPNKWLRIASTSLWISLILIPLSEIWLFHYAPLFSVGILFFMHHEKLLNQRESISFLILSVALLFYYHNLATALVALASLCWIAQGKGLGNLGQWLGKVSYSLYLLHIPIGASLVLDFSQNFVSGDVANTFLIIAALLVSLFSAWLMYKIIEKPFQTWTKKLN
ncbi:MAG: acyltransferase [Aureispira sp.]|nr:acyltransferase [Aureispira sp.]